LLGLGPFFIQLNIVSSLSRLLIFHPSSQKVDSIQCL
jgi:hypothetical protein